MQSGTFACVATDKLCARHGGTVSISSNVAVVQDLSIAGTLRTSGPFAPSGALTITDTTPATATTGAVLVSGGVSSGGGLFVGNAASQEACLQFWKQPSSLMNCYAEDSRSYDFFVDPDYATVVGSCVIKMVRLGSMVCLTGAPLSFACAAQDSRVCTATGVVPSGFRPSVSVAPFTPGYTDDGGLSFSHYVSKISVTLEGKINLLCEISSSGWPSGSSGLGVTELGDTPGFSMSYVILNTGP